MLHHHPQDRERKKSLNSLVLDINAQIALFRDLLIGIGQSRDCPEHRERIRKLRRNCVDACKHTSQLILPHIRSAVEEGIPADNQNLVMLYFMAQLFHRELCKSHRLVQIIPMDMSGYYDNRAGPSNLGNVISQILLCKQITPDFNQEELCSIIKDSQEIANILKEMGEYMPKQENNLEKSSALNEDVGNQWTKKRRNSLYKHMGLLCCTGRPNYL
ncbi:uncharacterized protein LOC132695726 isoform X2 [Cylas formicarius]|uniref:uncharacterized protein LOC132695726 isoform X2 n=1 Tax=Cylas formicarius TaxID=197179 RepID=UPI00295849AC|nr:uncharacterized protein LOC132695726 isoform X2 [Cylas formicarius]